jgi:hypothetical protein
MLAQDPVTGQLYEVPDSNLYEANYAEYPEFPMGEPPVVYDGLGNPVGLPFLAPIAAALAPAAGGLLPQAGRIFGGLFGRRPAPALPALPAPMGPPAPFMPRPFPFPSFAPRPRPLCRAPAPVGWITPALPFTGMQPRRLYLRCSVWPGQAGMVPGFATQPVTPPAVPVAPAVVPLVGRRRRRRSR